jgi:hypothetical protein
MLEAVDGEHAEMRGEFRLKSGDIAWMESDFFEIRFIFRSPNQP